MRIPTRSSTLFALLALALAAMPAVAAPPTPSYGTANVDGFYAEWNLVNDFYTLMYRAGNPSKPVESRAYLRYDCGAGVMYVLVLMEPTSVGYIDPNAQTAWVAINAQNNKVVTENSGDDGIAPDFRWVGQAYDGDPQHVRGYEASFPLATGSYNIIFHVDVWDATAQTSASPGFPGTGPPVTIDCSTPTRPGTWGKVKALYR